MRMRFSAVALTLLVAACSSPSGPKPAELPQLEHEGRVRELWSASAGEAERFVFSPAVADGSIYAAAANGTVTRFELGRGRTLWSVSSGVKLSGGVGTDGTTVAVASEDGEIVALDAATGKKRWAAQVSSEVLAAPAVGAGLVLVRSIDNRLFAFGADDGKRRWIYQRAPSSLIIRSPAGITIDGENAFAGFAGGKLAAVALSNGGLRWEATVALPKGGTELERVTDVVGDPVVQGQEVCAAAYQGRIACYEAATGRQLWARDVSSLTGISVDARYAFVSDDRGAVQAFDRTNGRSLWKQDKLAHRQLSRPQPIGELVAVGDLEGYVHFLARETGAFVARYSTDGSPVRAAPRAIPGGLLVQTQNGAVYALAP
ncbi:MAG TPA: outer membrane protein assembly factor BamB [Burkholderiales bacterium]|nr:outer membrane protein assembly factor BamB [Burkholderiales bacterium]